MIKNKKTALMFCVDNTERKILSRLMHTFSFEVIEENFIDEVLNLVQHSSVDSILINEDKEQLFGLRKILKKAGYSGIKFILFRKSLVYLHLKFFSKDENHTSLMVDLKDSGFDQRKELSNGNENFSKALNRNLLSMLCHEIFTPLNSVIGFSQLLQKFSYSETEVRTYSGFINKSGREMQGKCTLLLDFVALSRGELKTHLSHFSVVSLFSEVYERYKFQKQSVFINVEYDYALQDVEIYTDKAKIERMLEMLLDNALKFTDIGKVSFGFSIKKNKSLTFFVKDTGIGITEADKSNVFEAFWQVDSSDSRKYYGLGIGLHLVKEFSDLLNGQIVLDSQVGKGTCIQVEIPLVESMVFEEIASEKSFI
ncbi:hypothetical protein BZG02_00225 [Labilibaculum filiforme]|uniref:histidine kinase n=1 Tax=Labilibaculum filiforme TaxID=1940526 RepID=A0A2N3I584_9BACT|nr:HAMP domain-containing sensor histidine kinase [Labilibaculum filiforme]PKQ65469.1 hypothetical protein BZG02_00225 [Labilibaculum filiforme]